MKVKEESEKTGLKLNIKPPIKINKFILKNNKKNTIKLKKQKRTLNIQKTKIMASSPITLWQIHGETWKQCQTLFSWVPKSLQIVTAAMKLKCTGSLEEKL